MQKRRVVNRINTPVVCIVSTTPPDGGGVSTYTKNLTESFNFSSFHIVILSQKNNAEKFGKNPFSDKIKIVNCWNAGIFYPFQIFKSLCQNKPQIVHVQHEYFIFGRAISAALFPLVILLGKFLRLKTIVTLHGIVNPVEIRDPELGSLGNENLQGIPIWLSQMGLLLITRLITDTSDKIIVMNNTHKNVLIEQYRCSPEKLVLVPHGIPKSEPIDTEIAKKRLGFDGQKVVLYFGYITKYKGIDILVKAFKNIQDPNCVLVIGGAAHPRLKNDPDYKKFWDAIMGEISGDKRIKFVGFIPDDQLSTYISASDVVVFPYVASFSTGGPMNITVGHYKPVIASKVSSFSDILPESAVFKTGSVSDLTQKLRKSLEDDSFNLELSKSARSIAAERSWQQVAKCTEDLYYHILEKHKS
jgi:glycosyltransferase involved in cell wall biosynthesis